MSATEVLVEVRDLVKHFPITRGIVFQRKIGAEKAVDGVSLQVMKGETLGIVGETGCGKTTTARLMMRLLEPTAGEVRFDGRDITHSKGAELKAVRRELQMVFQDPYSSLNPRKTVGSIVGEPFAIHGMHRDRAERRGRVRELMDTVGLNPEHYNRYPHEFSGGQRQRIGVARALALGPKLLIADEPVSALDVSIQAQVLNLLRELQRSMGLTLVLISHDLSVVRHMCDRVAVMYKGKIVELESNETLYNRPATLIRRSCSRPCPGPARIGVRSPGDDPRPGCRGPSSAAGLDPLRHGQPAGERACGAGVPQSPPDGGGVRVRAARRRAGRPNLLARLRGDGSPTHPDQDPTHPGPTLCYLGHVDTVLANPAEWSHDPWSGDLADGFVWGRGALDMKSQVAAEIAAAAGLARSGWRPAQGRAADRGGRRRGDRGRAGRAMDLQGAPGEGALRDARERGRRVRVRVRLRARTTGCAAPRRACSASRSRPTAWRDTLRCPGWARTRC